MSKPLTELLARIESASGPDRELDHEIQLYIMNGGRTGSFSSHEHWLSAAKRYGWNSGPYTASVDAALALVERMLPGCPYVIDATAPGDGIDADLFQPMTRDATNGWRGSGKTPALAILAALLKALIAKEPADHGQ